MGVKEVVTGSRLTPPPSAESRLARPAIPHQAPPLDNLTHGLVGAALSKAGLDRTTPLATATLIIAANAPDIDVLSYLGGEYFALAFRRGITHGWPALIILPFLVAGGILAWDRWVRRRRRPEAPPARALPVLALSAIGIVTHPLLDWMNTYGMRWGLPFDPGWTYGDALFIIDPWIWLILGGALFIASRPGRKGRIAWALVAVATSLPVLLFPLPTGVRVLWIGGLAVSVALRRLMGGEGASPWPAAVALAAITLYISGMVGSDRMARGEVAAAAQAAGLEAHDVMVAPLPANPFSGEVEVLTEAGYVPGDFRWRRSPKVRLFPEEVVPLRSAPPEMDAEVARLVAERARAHENARHYLTWSRYPFVRIAVEGEGWTVTFGDARYDGGVGGGTLSGVTVTVLPPDIR